MFEVGKVYDGYEVESRTACYVTFAGESRRKIFVVNGTEEVNFVAAAEDGGFQVKIKASEATHEFSYQATESPKPVESPATETFFIPIVAHYDNRDCHNTPADHAHAMATPYSAPHVELDAVEVLAKSLGYELVNLSVKKNKPMYRLIQDGVMIPSNKYGSGCCLFDVRAFLEAQALAQKTTSANDPETFNVGQTYECNAGLQFTVANRIGDTVEFTTRFVKKIIATVKRDARGEFVKMGDDRLYACETPKWFHGIDADVAREYIQRMWEVDAYVARECIQRMWDRDESRERVEFTPYTYDLMRY